MMNLDELLKAAISDPSKRSIFLQTLIRSDVYVICKNPVKTGEKGEGVQMDLVTIQNPDGDLFIGTWSSGLFRFDPSAAAFFAYPAFNEAGSAFSLLLDSRDRLQDKYRDKCQDLILHKWVRCQDSQAKCQTWDQV